MNLSDLPLPQTSSLFILPADEHLPRKYSPRAPSTWTIYRLFPYASPQSYVFVGRAAS